jgi:hypothetical protein
VNRLLLREILADFGTGGGVYDSHVTVIGMDFA